MKRALIYSLSAALLLVSLSACNQPQDTRETDQSEPTQAATSTPEQTTAPEQLSERTGTTNTEKQELSGDALTEYFKLAYMASDGLNYLNTLDEKIDFELRVLDARAENEGQLLPSDYAEQYRAWRPVDETQEPIQQVSDTTQNQNQSKPQQQQTNQNQTENQGSTQQTKPSTQSQPTAPSQNNGSGSYDPYDGYGSYDAYIDAMCSRYPQFSREEIIDKFPDEAGIHVNQGLAQADAENGRLTSG